MKVPFKPKALHIITIVIMSSSTSSNEAISESPLQHPLGHQHPGKGNDKHKKMTAASEFPQTLVALGLKVRKKTLPPSLRQGVGTMIKVSYPYS